MNMILSVKDAGKKFGRKQVLDGIDVEIPAGRIVGLLGPNGAGKTTLLNTIMDIYRLDSGKIEICGEPSGYHAKRLISYLPDTNHLFSWMHVRDALNYYTDMFPDFDITRAKELCILKNIETLLDDVIFLNKGKVIFTASADNIREVHGQSIEECYMEVFGNV